MIRMLGAGLMLAGLGGCATPADGAWWRDLAGLPSASGAYRFDWRIAGDPALAPLQVFDDGRETWLQYPADQPAPAVFERTAGGDRLLRPRRERDYLILRGVPDRIVLRGGLSRPKPGGGGRGREGGRGGRRRERRAGAGRAPADARAAPPGRRRRPRTAGTAGAGRPIARPVRWSRRRHRRTRPPSGRRREPGRVLRGHAGRRQCPAGAGAQALPVGRSSLNTGRWMPIFPWRAPPSSVTHSARPCAACCRPPELGDRPVQPCFYANRVLRVVPLAQRCDRTRVPGVDS